VSDQIEICALTRLGDSQRKARRSVDFLVNGESLFIATEAKHSDMCGRFSSDVPAQTRVAARIFTLQDQPDLASGRSLLFVCPECGDLGCGAIAVRVSRNEDVVIWSDFAYENGYEPASPVNVGPFSFAIDRYEQIIAEALDA
jgi:hypothetical protein